MYLTFYHEPKDTQRQLTFQEALDRLYAGRTVEPVIPQYKYQHTQTINTPYAVPPNHAERITRMWLELKGFQVGINALLEYDRHELYHSFQIPKRTGGMRQIDAPIDELKVILRMLNDTFNYKLHALPHNAAHAYVGNRSTLTGMQVHQKNKSRWFLKLDIKDFFPSCTTELIHTQLKQLHPFWALYKTDETLMNKIVDIATLDGKLPQGSPLSPTLTNLMMIPLDHIINVHLQTYQPEQRFVYTRYADDILISSRTSFAWREMQTEIQRLFDNKFIIKTEKTRYGSSAGRNWNLGLMLNKDNNITIGYKEKERLRAMAHNLTTNPTAWTLEGLQVFQGKLSYVASIEPAHVQALNAKYQHFGYTLDKAIKEEIKRRRD